jgi:putative ABC transport system permease protein
LLRRLTALWAALFRSSTLDADMDEEMRFHVEMQAERLMRERGLGEQEARRQAFVAFGGVEKFKEEGRDTRGVQWLDAIRQDGRLAIRMLVKYPALTLIGGFAMAVAIAIGSLTFEAVSETLDTTIPIGDGHRLVAIQFATDAQGQPERRVLRDFVEWREGLQTVQQLSAFRTTTHNLAVGGSYPEPIRVGEVTASTFDVANTPPLLGRVIQPQDEIIGAAPVIVIGWKEWQTRFAADPALVGRTLMLGSVAHIIVGVMPEGFAFPVSHEYWIPLQTRAAQYGRVEGPELFVFGTLAPGATLAQVQAELSAVGQRTVTAFPDAYARLRLIALPYAREHLEIDRPAIARMLRIVQLLIGGLLVVVAANLSILMYARAVTRLGDLALRSALGASRRRLLTQMFVEALALSLTGAAAGLVIAKVTLTEAIRPMLVASGGVLPFWIAADLSAGTVVYAIGLAIVAAFIVGVLPGLRTTGQQTQTNLRALGGGTGAPLGGLWTTLIVTQVAIAAAILPAAVYLVGGAVRMQLQKPAFPAEQYLLAHTENAGQQREIVSRLEREADVRQVTLSSGVPGYEGSRRLQFEDAGATDARVFDVTSLDVAVGFFEVYDATILAGRNFTPADAGSTNVIVNRTFAQDHSGDAGVLGRRLSFVPRSADGGGLPVQYQIVGVVDDFPKFPPLPGDEGRPTLYQAIDPGAGRAVLTVRYQTPITSDTIGHFRRVVAEVDPAPLRSVTTLTEFYRVNREPWRLMAIGFALITASVLLLSAGGIYALMSFTVAQRTREIGIRSALGANPRRLLAGIFGRVLAQLAIGLVVGCGLSGTLLWLSLEAAEAAAVFSIVATVILIVGVAAAIGPARRGLRVEPTEALRIDA